MTPNTQRFYPLRIAMLIRDLGYAGAQRQLVAIAKGLKADGHDVTVICFYGGPMQAELEAAKVSVIDLEKTHRWDLLGFLWRLVWAIWSAKPEVFYSFLSESNLLAALLKPLLPGTRIIWGLRDSETDAALYGWVGKLVFALGRWLSVWPDLFIANSHSGARYYIAQGYPAENMTVVPNGIDSERFKPDAAARAQARAAFGVRDNETLFGVVGRLSPMKDYATFLRAAAALKGQPVRFVCIGSGSTAYAREMEELAIELGIGAKVIWREPRSDMPAVFNAMDALVSSSAFGEGFSNVAGEAMACGTPCIVTDVGDSAWLVGDTGFHVPPCEPNALAIAMLDFMNLEQDQRSELQHKARARIEKHFTIPTMLANTRQAIDKTAPPIIPQRLLFTITALGTGGAEMMLTQLVTGLDKQRFEPHVVSLTDGGKYAAILREAGVPVYSLGMVAGMPSLGALLRLRRLTKHIHPDLLVGWMYHGNLAATLASWIGKRAPVLWNIRQSLYSLAHEKRGSKLVIRLLPWLGFNPKHILYNSQISAGQHGGNGYHRGKAVIVPNGFNTDAFKPDNSSRQSLRRELGLPPSALLIGRFGRNSAMKDYPTFLKAMEQLPNAHAVIAGTGTEQLESLVASDESLETRVHILGEFHDLPWLTSAIDIACSSSAFGEGFPNIVAEAMSCGVPCVATDVGDSAWLLGNAGRIVPAGNADALAVALAELLSLPAHLRASIGQQGRERILNDFSLPAVVRTFESLFLSTTQPLHSSTSCVA